MNTIKTLLYKYPRGSILVVAGGGIVLVLTIASVVLMALQANETGDTATRLPDKTQVSLNDEQKKSEGDQNKPAEKKQEPKKTEPKPTQKPAPSTSTAPSTPAPAPAPTPAPTPVPTAGLQWPTPQNTGPRISSFTAYSGVLQSSYDGQVISGYSVTGRIEIRHNNVIVRDSRILGTATYMLEISDTSSGSCPTNPRIEYIEIDGHLGADNLIPIYGNGCGFVFDHGYVHNVGRSSRIQNNATVSNSYIHSSLTGDSGAHRGAVGINGGSNNVIFNNVLKCSGRGCSAAIPNYGDFAQVTNLRIEHNLLSTTGGYCAYGGSLSGKPYPYGTNIDFINNHFSTEFYPRCGQFGPISGYASGVRGNDWISNVWHESGAAIPAP